MGNATPSAPYRSRRTPHSVPELLDPYPPEFQTTEPVPEDVLERLRQDPWALQTLDSELRERPEVLRAVIQSGHPQAMEAISVCVAPEVLRRPEIYGWLKDYREQILPARVLFFQGSLGVARQASKTALSFGGEFGAGTRHAALKFIYDLQGSGGNSQHRLGLEAATLLYPAKRISLRERQSVVSIGLPIVKSFSTEGRDSEVGIGLAYYLMKGEGLATPVFGIQTRILTPVEEIFEESTANLELQIPVWSTMDGIQRLIGALRRP